MSDISPPSALPGSALAALETDLALALRAPNVAVDRELLAAYVDAASPNSIRALRQDVEIVPARQAVEMASMALVHLAAGQLEAHGALQLVLVHCIFSACRTLLDSRADSSRLAASRNFYCTNFGKTPAACSTNARREAGGSGGTRTTVYP